MATPKCRSNSNGIALRILIDICCVVIVFLPVPLFKFVAEPFHRGFFCNDESLRHPYHENTISDALLVSMGLAIPIVSICLCEAIHWHNVQQPSIRNRRYTVNGKIIHPYVWLCYKTIGFFLFGAAVSQSITDFAKYCSGRLRPHWFAVCKPTLSDTICKNSFGEYLYVEDELCTGDESKIREARLSFISGHASFSFYCLTYLSLYLQVRMTWKGGRLLRHTLQVVFLVMAYWTALSRISDYKHHWSDVLAGSVVGITVSCLIAFFVSDLFKTKRYAHVGVPNEENELSVSVSDSLNAVRPFNKEQAFEESA